MTAFYERRIIHNRQFSLYAFEELKAEVVECVFQGAYPGPSRPFTALVKSTEPTFRKHLSIFYPRRP